MAARPIIFGEVLFDHFPDGRRVLGGAPFNVAWHLQALGLEPHLISRVGDDEAGQEIRRAMEAWSMDTRGLQTDPELPTGRVSVTLEEGEPKYEIVHPSAWDAIEPLDTVPSARLLYHGTLALRDARSRSALRRLRQSAAATVFVDVNLRPPWWNREMIAAELAEADWVKLNDSEFSLLGTREGRLRDCATGFIEAHGLHGLIVTRGSAGAVIATARGDFADAAPGAPVTVKDTVGAGDAFSAVVILGLARRWPVETTLECAMDFAARVCGRHGATVADPAFYTPLIRDWKLEEDGTRDV